MKKFFVCLTLCATSLMASVVLAAESDSGGRRLEVLFLGDQGHHKPIDRYRILKQALGKRGINLTYTEQTTDLNPTTLAQFDSVLLYANLSTLTDAQEQTMMEYVNGGGGFAPVHCASACFGHSEAFIRLVGGRFKSHGTGVFTATIVAPEHPVMQGFTPFETWDETYVHDRHNEEGRKVLMKHVEEPWTWVREQGKGRVFYTAHGHDERCWNLPGFQDLIYRGLVWSAGDAAKAALEAYKLPVLEFENLPIANYQTKQALTAVQKPLSPEDSIKMAQLPIGLSMRVFSSEPDVYNPLAITWDERGRTFVSVTDDYPHDLKPAGTGNDKILLLHDENGDGVAERSTVFADKLSIPTAIIWSNNGIIAVDSNTIVHLSDADGDGVAEQRRTLITGVGTSDTHAGTSSFTYGFDNWIYATSGYAGFRGTVGGEEHDFRMGVYRFRPDGSKLEFLQATTNNTWGLGVLESGEIMGSTANGNPSWYHTIPRNLTLGAGLEAAQTPRADTSWLAYPNTSDVRQVDWYLGYSAAANHRIYTARLLPERFWNQRAFVCEPTAHVIAAAQLTKSGTQFRAEFRAPEHLLATADGWSSPISADVGPDGAVWILDWYHCVVQHNPTPKADSAGIDAEKGRYGAYQTPYRHSRYGRVFRILPKDGKTNSIPKLDPANPDSLLAGLSHDNLLWRSHAQRLLVERGKKDVWPRLVNILRHGPSDAIGNRPGAVHALGTLAGLGAFDSPSAWTESLLTELFQDRAPAVRRFALRFAPRSAAFAPGILAALGREKDADVAKEALLALAQLPPDEATGAQLWQWAATSPIFARGADPVLGEAFTIACTRHATGVVLAAATGKAWWLEKPANTPLAIDVAASIRHIISKIPGGAARSAVTDALTSSRLPMAADWLAALNAVPASEIPVQRRFPIDKVVHERALKVYEVTCLACHQADGKGLPPGFPPLDRSPTVTGNPAKLIRIAHLGLTGKIEVLDQTYDATMPGHPQLTDQELADVLTYVRQSWSNDSSPISPAEVQTLRANMATRTAPWTVEELDKL